MHVQVYTSSQYPSVFVVFPICTLDHQINKKTFTEGFPLFIDFGCKSVTWEKYTVKEVIRPPLAHPIDIDVFYLFFQKQKRAYGYIPILWVLSTTEKRGTCDDASTMTLVVQMVVLRSVWYTRQSSIFSVG